jgi:hypothetical protein
MKIKMTNQNSYPVDPNTRLAEKPGFNRMPDSIELPIDSFEDTFQSLPTFATVEFASHLHNIDRPDLLERLPKDSFRAYIVDAKALTLDGGYLSGQTQIPAFEELSSAQVDADVYKPTTELAVMFVELSEDDSGNKLPKVVKITAVPNPTYGGVQTLSLGRKDFTKLGSESTDDDKLATNLASVAKVAITVSVVEENGVSKVILQEGGFDMQGLRKLPAAPSYIRAIGLKEAMTTTPEVNLSTAGAVELAASVITGEDVTFEEVGYTELNHELRDLMRKEAMSDSQKMRLLRTAGAKLGASVSGLLDLLPKSVDTAHVLTYSLNVLNGLVKSDRPDDLGIANFSDNFRSGTDVEAMRASARLSINPNIHNERLSAAISYLSEARYNVQYDNDADLGYEIKDSYLRVLGSVDATGKQICALAVEHNWTDNRVFENVLAVSKELRELVESWRS